LILQGEEARGSGKKLLKGRSALATRIPITAPVGRAYGSAAYAKEDRRIRAEAPANISRVEVKPPSTAGPGQRAKQLGKMSEVFGNVNATYEKH